MTIHITNLNGMQSTAGVAQNTVTHFAKQLGINPINIYCYINPNESAKELNARFDGIIAALKPDDTVIIQSPNWMSYEWDRDFMNHLDVYPKIKKIILIHDVLPLMTAENKYLMPKYIDYYNQADGLIVHSEEMYQTLRDYGMNEKPYTVMHFFDHLAAGLNTSIQIPFTKTINFAGSADKFDFVKNWNNKDIHMQVFSNPQEDFPKQNLNLTGFKSDIELMNTLRQTGGFGLTWSTDPVWRDYMKINASFKTSTYLAAGLPIIIDNDSPEAKEIRRRNLGFTVDNLEQACHYIEDLNDSQYAEMLENVKQFSKLINNGYFTKCALSEAIFKLYY